jgi:hypothetical protein
MTRAPRKPSTAGVRGVLLPFVRIGAAVLGTLLLIGFAFFLAQRCQEPSPRGSVVRVILENRSDRPLRAIRIVQDDGTVLAEPSDIPVGGRVVLERPLGTKATWSLTFDQLGHRHVFSGFTLDPSYADLKIITVTPGPCIGGERADVVERR